MPKLPPIYLTMEAAIVRHALRNISAFGRMGSEQTGQSYGVKRVIFKTADFGVNFLPAQRLAFGTLWIMWYTHLVLRLGSRIFGLPLQRKTLATLGAPGPPIRAKWAKRGSPNYTEFPFGNLS